MIFKTFILTITIFMPIFLHANPLKSPQAEKQINVSLSNKLELFKTINEDFGWSFKNGKAELIYQKRGLLGYFKGKEKISTFKIFSFKPNKPIDQTSLKITFSHETTLNKNVKVYLIVDEDPSTINDKTINGKNIIWEKVLNNNLKTITIDNLPKSKSFGIHNYQIVFHSSINQGLKISSIDYKDNELPCDFKKVLFSDKKNLYINGNGDSVISPFETVKIKTKIKCSGINRDALNISLSSNSLQPLSEFQILTPSDLVEPTADEFDYFIMVTPLLSPKMQHKDNVIFTIKLSAYGLTKEKSFQSPYQHMLGDDMALSNHVDLSPFNFEDPNQLDSFLSNYSNSVNAPTIFAIRSAIPKELARQAKTEDELLNAMEEYHKFIQKYQGYAGIEIATHELFKLYEKLNRVEGYLDFIARYPTSLDALVGDEYIKKMLYERALQINTIESYDEFLKTYPNSEPFTSQIAKKAQTIYIEQEGVWLQEMNTKFSTDIESRFQLTQKISERSTKILEQLYELKESLNKTKKLSEMSYLKVQMDRYAAAIEKHYKDTKSFQTLLILKDTQDIIGAIDHLSNLIEKENIKTRNLIKSEFKGLKGFLSERFDHLDKSLTKIETILNKQNVSIQAIDDHLKELSLNVDQHFKNLEVNGHPLQTAGIHMFKGGKKVLSKLSNSLPSYDGFKRFSTKSLKTVSIFLKDRELQKIFQVKALAPKICKVASAASVAVTSVTGIGLAGSTIASTTTKKLCQWCINKVVKGTDTSSAIVPTESDLSTQP